MLKNLKVDVDFAWRSPKTNEQNLVLLKTPRKLSMDKTWEFGWV